MPLLQEARGNQNSEFENFSSRDRKGFSFFKIIYTPVFYIFIFPFKSTNFILFLKFIYFNWRLTTLQYCIGFAIHQHESATGFWTLWEREKVG